MTEGMTMAEPLAAEFWQGCAAGELRYRRCASCGAAPFPPRPFCRRCGGATRWEVSRGQGTVYATTRVTRAPTPDFAALVPYDILLVDLDEGFRMMAHGAPGLGIGERVRVGFRRHGGRALPHVERSGEEG
jgi:uncharacterized protein